MRYWLSVCLLALAACGGGAVVQDAAVVDTRAATDTAVVVDSAPAADTRAAAEGGADVATDARTDVASGDARADASAADGASCPDNDGDGHGAMGCCIGVGPGSVCGDDCNDNDPLTYAGAPEACDGVDQDCDGWADESAHDPTTNRTMPETDADAWCLAHAPGGISASAPFDRAPPRCFSNYSLPNTPGTLYRISQGAAVTLYCEACRPCIVDPSYPTCLAGADCECWDRLGRSWACGNGPP